jgi:hypothetical protein
MPDTLSNKTRPGTGRPGNLPETLGAHPFDAPRPAVHLAWDASLGRWSGRDEASGIAIETNKPCPDSTAPISLNVHYNAGRKPFVKTWIIEAPAGVSFIFYDLRAFNPNGDAVVTLSGTTVTETGKPEVA